MFGIKSKPQQNTPMPRKNLQARDTAVTIITSGCHFNGKLYCRGSSRIGGRIEGQIVSEGLLIIEEEAHINADIKADELTINGEASGNIDATNKVSISTAARVSGDIKAPRVVIEDGAVFNGSVEMDVKLPDDI